MNQCLANLSTNIGQMHSCNFSLRSESLMDCTSDILKCFSSEWSTIVKSVSYTRAVQTSPNTDNTDPKTFSGLKLCQQRQAKNQKFVNLGGSCFFLLMPIDCLQYSYFKEPDRMIILVRNTQHTARFLTVTTRCQNQFRSLYEEDPCLWSWQ